MPTQTVSFTNRTTDLQVVTGFGAYAGLSLMEATGTSPATVYLRDGTGPSAPLIDTITLAPNESVRDSYNPPRNFSTGLYLQVVSGTVSGVVVMS
jgi:hypothetical protein